MVDTVVIENANPTAQPTLEEQAAAAGIDVNTVDPSANEQTAEAKILGKFNTQEDLVKAYQELEKKLGQGNKEEEAPTPEAEKPTVEEEAPEEETKPEDNNEKTPEEQAKEAAEKSGLDLNDLSAKYWEKGALEESDYEALEKNGYPKTMVDQFIAGQRAIVELETAKVHNAVGGTEAYQSMIDWASGSLSEAEVTAYDKAVNSSDMDVVMNAVKGLKARFDNEVGFEPTRQVGGKTSAGDNSVYESINQLTSDMGNPLYQTDPAFRAKVEQKLARSSIL